MFEKLTVAEGPPVDPESIREMARYRKNREWLGAHTPAFFIPFRGRYVAAAGGEVFVSHDPWEAERLAKSKHPEDDPFVTYIPPENVVRIYAC